MGLRIIDRRRPREQALPTEAERLAYLRDETRHWIAAKGDLGVDFAAEFIDNFRRVRARLASPSQMSEMASRIRDNIRDRTQDSAQSHNRVDVATLLELL